MDFRKRNDRGLPPDLWTKRVHVGPKGTYQVEGGPASVDRETPPPYLGQAIYLSKGFQGRSVTVGTTATLIEVAGSARPYLILNPSRSVGLTTSFTIFSGNVVAAGNTQLTPIGVANFLNGHFHLNVTAIAGTWDLIQQSRCPITGVWADVQTVFAAVVGPAANYYAFVGQLGIAVDMAFRWNPVAPGNMTFTLSGTLKEGTIGSGAGLAQTVFLGSNDGISLNSGYPLLEGQEKAFIIGENVELWGIAATPVTINVFEL